MCTNKVAFTYSLVCLCLGSLLEQPLDRLWVHLLVDLFEYGVTLLETKHDALLDLRELDGRHLLTQRVVVKSQLASIASKNQDVERREEGEDLPGLLTSRVASRSSVSSSPGIFSSSTPSAPWSCRLWRGIVGQFHALGRESLGSAAGNSMSL